MGGFAPLHRDHTAPRWHREPKENLVKKPSFLLRPSRSTGAVSIVVLALAMPVPSVAASGSATYTVLVGYSQAASAAVWTARLP